MDDKTTPYKIKNGVIYQDYFEDYKKLNLEDKNKILCAYIEMYKMNPFELLETPTAWARTISSEAAYAERSTTISKESTSQAFGDGSGGAPFGVVI